MPFIVKDRIKETTTTTGTGTITLAGASSGFRSFADIGNGNETYYAIVGGTEWEVGIGTYTSSGTTLSRNTVLSNSLGTTALISFSAGSKDVFCTYPSSAAVITVSTTPPTTPVNGTLWWSSDEGKLKIYYVDANSSQWVDALTASTGSFAVAPDLHSPSAIGDVTPNTGKFTTLTTTENFGVNTTPDGTSWIQIAAGTASKAPLELITSAGVLMTTPDDGSIEYDGSVFYGTPIANSRGVMTTEHFVARTGTKTMTSNTSLQSIFGGGTGGLTNGALTVASTETYYFECSINVSSMSATSGNLGFSISGGGTATFTSAAWHAFGLDATTQTTAAAIGGSFSSSAGQTGNIVTAATGTAVSVFIKGIFRINAGGTIIPSIQLTTAAAAVIGSNCWFKCYPVGSDTVVSTGNWS